MRLKTKKALKEEEEESIFRKMVCKQNRRKRRKYRVIEVDSILIGHTSLKRESIKSYCLIYKEYVSFSIHTLFYICINI